MRERLRALGRLEPVDNVFKLWRRVPGRIRGAVPVLAVVTLAATYPYYVSSLPTDVPVILAFPDVGAAVTAHLPADALRILADDEAVTA